MSTPSADRSMLPVTFDGDTLYLIDHAGQPHVPVKPIAEALGINWATQTVKLKHNGPRWGVAMIATPSPGGTQDMLCMPLRKLPAYLYSIEARKVRPEARPKVERYQAECDDALWDYWNNGHAVNPRLPEPAADPAALVQEVTGLRLELAQAREEVFTLKGRVLDLQDFKIAQLERAQAKPKRPATRPLTPAEADRIRALAAQGLSGAEIARRIGRSAGSVSWVLRGAEVSHV